MPEPTICFYFVNGDCLWYASAGMRLREPEDHRSQVYSPHASAPQTEKNLQRQCFLQERSRLPCGRRGGKPPETQSLRLRGSAWRNPSDHRGRGGDPPVRNTTQPRRLSWLEATRIAVHEHFVSSRSAQSGSGATEVFCTVRQRRQTAFVATIHTRPRTCRPPPGSAMRRRSRISASLTLDSHLDKSLKLDVFTKDVSAECWSEETVPLTSSTLGRSRRLSCPSSR